MEIFKLNNELDLITKQKDFIKRKIRQEPHCPLYKYVYQLILEEEKAMEEKLAAYRAKS